MAKRWDVVVAGAGHNGLVTAAYLAKAGLKVCVLERRHLVGGAAVTEEIFPGYKFSTASYLCSLLHERIIRELELPRHGYQVYAKDPAFFTPFPNGQHFTMWQDQKKTCAEIAKFSRRDAERYPEYEAYIERLAKFAEEMLFVRPPNIARAGMRDYERLGRLALKMGRMPDEEKVGHIRIFTQSVADFLEPWFESEELRVTLATDGVIGTNGGPYTPGTAYVLLHHVMGGVGGHRGLWGFVRGGMGGVSEAIAASAREAGAEIRVNATVEKIVVKEGRAQGVVLAGGEELAAKVVISGVDPKRTFLGMVGEAELPGEFAEQVRQIRMRGSSMKINLALDALPNFTALPSRNGGGVVMDHHKTTMHICPSVEYVERAWDEAKFGRASSRPMLEMTIPSTYDDTLAPRGKHVMNIFLQYTPYDLKEGDWRTLKEPYADKVMELIEEYAPGFKKTVVHRQVVSPLDLEETFGLTGGNIFHGEMSVDQLFFLRPVAGWARYRTPIRGLYLCGSGTHPGGGVMGIPGFNAAKTVRRDWRMRRI